MKLAVKMVGYIIKEMELIYEKKPIKNFYFVVSSFMYFPMFRGQYIGCHKETIF